MKSSCCSLLLVTVLIGFSNCTKKQPKPESSPYQTTSYHLYQKTVITKNYTYPAVYDTTEIDTNVTIEMCPDSLIWGNGDLFYRVQWDTTRTLYTHHLGYPYFVQLYDNGEKVEWRFENGANTRYPQFTSYWGRKQ